MKISYRREMRRNYMIIDPEGTGADGYEGRMLSGNAIDGVLKLQIRQMESGLRFYYDITSKQPLTRMFQAMRWKTEQILRLLQGIFSAMERLEEYLLNESDIYLDADYLYISPENFRVWLCVVPGLGCDFREMFGKLLEKLLEHVDHEDKPSVILAYGIYQATRREDYGVEDILNAIRQEMQKVRMQENAGAEDGRGCDRKSGLFYGRFSDEGRSTQSAANEISVPAVAEERKPSVFSGLSRKLGIIIHRNPKASAGQGQNPRAFFPQGEPDPAACGESEEDVPESWISEAGEETASGEGENLPEEPSVDYNQHVLIALTRQLEDIPILYCPFIIGKQEKLVDYRLNYETVSRLHVRIDRSGDSFLIQDLNSTNGTMINGRLLENNEEAEIQPGDEIDIASYRYRFE